MNNLSQALKLIANRRSRPSVRLLDAIYGPQAKTLRWLAATILADGIGVKVSDKRVQYGNLRAALVAAVGATGNCIAAVDADFEERAELILSESEPMREAGSKVTPGSMPLG